MPTCDPDVAAKHLAEAGRWFKSMPPCWNGGRIAQPLLDPNTGAFLGKALMGTGILLAGDFPSYGIRAGARIPHVYERSKVMYGHDLVAKVTERLSLPPEDDPFYRTLPGRFFSPQRAAVEMARAGVVLSKTVDIVKQIVAAITSYDGIIAARTAGGGKANDAVFSKVSLGSLTAQNFYSLFRQGGIPVAGTYTNIPGGAVHTRATTGGWLGILSPITGGNKKYLLTFGYGSSSTIDWGILVDLLVGAGNITVTGTGNQTVNSTAQTRQYGSTLGQGVMATMEVTTALTTGTGTSSLVSYTDQDGNTAAASASGQSTASSVAGHIFPDGGNSPPPWYALASGDFGVRSVETFAFSAAHAGGGPIALNLVFPLAYLPGLISNVYLERDSTTQIDGLTELVQDGSNVVGCFVLFVQVNSTSTGAVKGFARTCEG